MPSYGSSSRDARPKARTAAERAEECGAVQRVLKQEAAERRLRAETKRPAAPAPARYRAERLGRAQRPTP